MKTTIREAMDIAGALNELAAEKHTNMVLMFRISHNLKKLKPVMESYEEAQNAAIEQFGKRDDKGALVPTPDGRGVTLADPTGFKAAFEPVLEQEVDVDDLKEIPWSILEISKVQDADKKTVPLAVRGIVIQALGPLVTGEPSAPESK